MAQTHMTENILSIAQWHQETFPDATLATQSEKFREEMDELADAADKAAQTGETKEMFLELADCAIVACGLCRWGMAAAKAFDTIVAIIEKIELQNGIDPKQVFMAAIEQKMVINRQRKWHNDHGKYQHIEQGGNNE